MTKQEPVPEAERLHGRVRINYSPNNQVIRVARTFWGELADLERQEARRLEPDRADRYARHMDGECRADCFCHPLVDRHQMDVVAYRAGLAGRARAWRDLTAPEAHRQRRQQR